MKNNIKRTIDAMGISQKELAKLVGMTEPGISKAMELFDFEIDEQ